MAKGFDLSARLRLTGPYNTKQVVSALKRELKTVKGSIDLKISPTAARNANVLNKALDTLQKNISRVSSNAMNATATINGLSSAFSQFGQGAKANNIALNATVKNMNKVKASASTATSEIESFGKSAGLAVKRFAAFTIATGAIFGFVAAVAKATGEAIQFQDELVKISQVTGGTVKSVQSLGDEVSNLAVKYGVSSKELLGAAKTLAQAGLSARETRKALDSLAKSTLAPSFDDLNNTTEGLISIFGQFRSELHGTKIAVEDFDSVLGSINQVSKDFAVEADDIVTAVRGAGSVFAQASEGIDKPKESLNKLIALFTSVRATTRESAESISTGLRTIFARIQRRSTIDFLKQFGVQLEDLEGKFVGPFEAVKRLNEGLKDLDPRDIRYSQIAEELGGIRQLSKLLPLIRQFPVALEAYDSAQKGTNSTTEDAIKAQQSLIVQFRKVREEFLRLVKDVLHTNSFSELAKTALDFASTMIKIASAVKSVAPYLAIALGIGAVKGGHQFLTGFKQAFTGGGKTTLAGGAGTAAGNILSGGNKNITSLDANTAALKALTVALVGSRSAGGPYPKGLHFAKGGIVPGTGNSDTVPAMLTPGEMVIPRKYVKGSQGGVNGLSAEELARIKAIKAGTFTSSKKSSGKDLIAGTNDIANPAVAGLFLQPQGTDLRTVRNGGIGSLSASAKNFATAAGAGPNSKIYYPFHAAFIEPSQAGKMKKDMDTLIKSSVRNIVNKYGGGSKINIKDRDNIIKQSNLAGAGGSVFEAFVQSLGDEFKKTDSGATWDVTPGAFGAGLKNLFGPIPSSIKHLDVKLTANEGAYDKLKDKTNAQIGQAGFGFHPYGGEHGKSYDEISRNNISTSFGNRTIKKFATGGMAMGTDTVPAMLTPGEYIVNKKSAQAIGYHNLNKINRYASGGTVKDNPLFNNGSFSSLSTNPTLAGKSGIQKLNFLDKFQRAFDGLSPTAQQLQNALKRYIQLVNKGVSSEDALVRVQTALTKVQAKQAQIYATQTSTTGNAAYAYPGGPPTHTSRTTLGGLRKRLSITGKLPSSEEIGQRIFIGAGAIGAAGATTIANAKSAEVAGIGGALTGAAGGAAAGFAAGGPIGAALGGLAGGIIGAKDAFEDFERSKALNRTELALTKFEKALSDFSFDNTKELSAYARTVLSSQNAEQELKALQEKRALKLENVGSFLNIEKKSEAQYNRNFAKTGLSLGARGSGYDRLFTRVTDEEANKGIDIINRQQADQILINKKQVSDPIVQQIKQAISSGNVTGAKNLINDNKDILAFSDSKFEKQIAQNIDKYRSSDTNQISEDIDKAAKTFDSLSKFQKDFDSLAISQSLKDAITQVDLLVHNINRFSAELERGTSISDKFANANDALLTQLQGGFAISKGTRENVFANVDAYSANEIGRAGSRLGSTTLTQGAVAGKILSDILPKALQQLDPGADNINLTSQFSNLLNEQEKMGVILPKEIREAIEASFKSELNNRATGDNLDKLKSADFSNSLLKPIQSFNETLKKAEELRLSAESKYTEELNKIIQTREAIETRQTDIDKVKADITKRRADREGRELTFGEATAGVRAKFSRLTTTPGFLGRPTTRNPDAATLGREITAAQAAQQEIANKGTKNNGLSPADIAEQARLGKLIKDNTEALTILRDSNEVLAAIENERSKIEKKKEAGRGIADKLFGGGFRGRAELNRQVGAAQAFLGGDNSGLTARGGKGYEDIKAGIATLVEIAKFQGDNKAAKEIGDKFDELIGIRKPGDEAALARAEEEASKVQLEAANALKTVAEVGLPTMIGNANNAFLQLQQFLSVAIAKFEGGIVKKASGGYISGSGGPRSDSIPAMLSNGEYVVNAAAVNRVGSGVLEHINRTGSLPGYADGGDVWEEYGHKRAEDFISSVRAGDRIIPSRDVNLHRIAQIAYRHHINGKTSDVDKKYIAKLDKGDRAFGSALLAQARQTGRYAYDGASSEDIKKFFTQEVRDSNLRNLSGPSVGGLPNLRGTTARSRAYAASKAASVQAGISTGHYGNTAYSARQYDRRQAYQANKAAGRRGRAGFASGGQVGYANGGSAGGNAASGISSAMGQFQSSVLILSQAVNKLAEINIPSNITMTGNHTVEVVINGASVLNDLLNGPLSGLIRSEIQSAIQKHIPLQQRMEGTY